jgi:t-SNARE complex subunit (syntaxin)
MATRNKTSVFLQYRQTQNSPMTSYSHPLPDIEVIKNSIQEVDGMISKLEYIYKQPDGFDELSKIKNICTINHAITKKLEDISDNFKNIDISANNTSEFRLKKNAQNDMLHKFQLIIQKYRHIQNTHSKKITEQEERYASLWSNVSDNHGLLQLEDHVEERDQDIQQIHDSIIELNKIFQDVQMLINDQEVIIDRIDKNIEATVMITSQAETELIQGEIYHKKSNNKFCILALILLLVVAGVLIIVIVIENK